MNLYHQKRYRVFTDESWAAEREPGKEKERWRYSELRGKYGMIYPYSHDWLGVQVKAGNVGEATRRANPGWAILQDCDDFLVFKVKNEELDKVAGIIRARKRRHLSEEQRIKASERLKKWHFTPATV